jgi:hypothetical protein
MKKNAMFILAVLGLFLPVTASLQSPRTTPEAMILRARATVLTPHFSRDDITKALIDVLDATLLILPESEDAKEIRSRVEVARKMLDEKALFSDKARQYLGLAYKLANGGKVWQLPEELKSPSREKDIMETANKVCLHLIDSGLAERKAGRNGQAVLRLLEFVIMVITPIQA